MSATARLVFGADVGGTNAKLALARFESDSPVLVERKIYPSARYPALEPIIEAFLAERGVASHIDEIHGACIAVAGPVVDGRGRLTNLPWEVDERAIGQRFGFGATRVINDFAAAGLGIAHLSSDDLLTLQPGTAIERAQRVIVGAGTGLGVALLDWDGTYYEVHPSEAGHCDFGPVDELQDRLLAHLRTQYRRVSYERVVSGSGLVRIFEFLEQDSAATRSSALKEAIAKANAAPAITDFALSARDALAVKALELFVCAYGSFAGNMALATLARGGVYVAGGIAPRIAAKLRDGAFIRAFTAKGRFGGLLESIPVHVVMNDQVGLYGALAEAGRERRSR
jgi:glucokinase